jgi:hypothetical protein
MDTIHHIRVQFGHPWDYHFKVESLNILVDDRSVLVAITNTHFIAFPLEFGAKFVAMKLISSSFRHIRRSFTMLVRAPKIGISTPQRIPEILLIESPVI